VPSGNDGVAVARYPWMRESDVGREAKPTGAPSSAVAPVPRICLSRSEAARALGIGLSTLKSLEREGAAPPYFDAPGGRRLYPVRSLVKWAESRAGCEPTPLGAIEAQGC
jgi:hypothetical protein